MAKTFKSFQRKRKSLSGTSGRRNNPARSLIRLALGATLVSIETLFDRTKSWEQRLNHPSELPTSDQTLYKDQAVIEPAQTNYFIQQSHPNHRRHVLIGFLFAAHDRFMKSIDNINRLERLSERVVSPFITPIANSRLLKPLWRRFDRLVNTGQAVIDRWAAIGEIEEEHSRNLIKTATQTTIDTSINYLSANPDVQELVQTQSTSLINEIIEEVRERTVSGDMFVDELIRSFLGLPSRKEIPALPPEVRLRAVNPRFLQKIRDGQEKSTIK